MEFLIKGSNSRTVTVTEAGQLVVAPASYDDVVYKELAEPDTAYNLYTPENSCRFVLTGLIIKADKQVSSTTEATVEVYEASSIDSTTVDKELFKTVVLQYDLLTLIPLNILSSQGKWINAKTTDDDVHITVMGYYIQC